MEHLNIQEKIQILFNQAQNSTEFIDLCKVHNIKLSDSTPEHLVKESWIKAKEEFNKA
jgi:hypothetical protein